MKKIAVFVDVQNIYYTTKHTFGKHFDYSAFWREIRQIGEIHCAYAYAIDRGDSKQHQFQNILKNIGFDVKLKPFIQRNDGSAKGDWDVGITIDIMESAANVDEIILLSGDGDFDRLLTHVMQKQQVFTRVYGVDQLTAQSLVRACSLFREIDSSLLLK
ncbi:NYN domain-containing protein [Marinomonas sp. 15G1-11]|uniref:NYN domain-containing protein n=1 Tax=Marinomonas phaeophyticola TaxID=3004091 RepID=A0ABT4JSE3_9GAMM|nr:NYN domain-containing protein [Marinomonas sp. 15G1-11]MCZ2721300.1 NYN domain-containing protein [Marinomonas sp. 15G1-11]